MMEEGRRIVCLHVCMHVCMYLSITGTEIFGTAVARTDGHKKNRAYVDGWCTATWVGVFEVLLNCCTLIEGYRGLSLSISPFLKPLV